MKIIHGIFLPVILVFVFSICFKIAYTQGTEELLKANKVDDFIYINPDLDSKTFEYQVDNIRANNKYGKKLNSKDCFTVSPRGGSIKLLVKYFNPFRYKVVLTDTLYEDDNFAALGKFFEAVTSLLNVIQSKNSAIDPASMTTTSSVVGESMKNLKSPLLQQWKYLYLRDSIEKCTPQMESLLEKLKDVDDAFLNDVNTFEIEVQKALDAVNNTDSLVELRQTYKGFEASVNKADSFQKASKKLISLLEDRVSHLSLNEPALKGPRFGCPEFAVYTKNVLEIFLNDVREKQVAREEAQIQLEALKSVLEKFLKKGVITLGDGEKIEAILVGSYAVEEEKITEVGMTLKERSVSFKENKLKIDEKGELISTKIRIRSHRVLIPEFATGLFYTSLSYPSFIANDNGDSIVVASGKTEKLNTVAAAHLNLVFNVWSDACPMLQVGIGTAKERPSILLGGGLRFSKPKRLALSLGAIWTWKKELSELSLGQKVKETAAVEKDLKLNFITKPGFYLGLQYNF